MNILVTGASGFIGAHACIALAQRGHIVIGLTRQSGWPHRVQTLDENNIANSSIRISRSNLKFFQGDLLNSQDLKKIFQNEKIEIVIHLAAYVVYAGQFREYDANLAHKLNVEATKNLAQHAANFGCSRFVYLGTAREYGDVHNTVTEAQPTNPVCLYGKTKLEGGLTVQTICSDSKMALSYFRLFNTYGPLEKSAGFFPSIIKSLANGEPMSLSDGHQSKDFLFISDVVGAIIALLDRHNGPAFELLNLASGKTYTLREIGQIACKTFKADSRLLRWGEVASSDREAARFNVDLTHIKKNLNWSPVIPIEEGVRQMRVFQ